MKMPAVGVREGRLRGASGRASQMAAGWRRVSRHASVGNRKRLWHTAALHLASGSLLRRATCQCFSLTARRAPVNGNCLSRPGLYPPSLCRRGAGEDARCSGPAELRRVNPGPQPQQSSFQKARAWRPRPYPLGTAPCAPPLTPPYPQAQGGGEGVGVAGRFPGSAHRGRRGQRAPGSAPVQRRPKTEVGTSGSQ